MPYCDAPYTSTPASSSFIVSSYASPPPAPMSGKTYPLRLYTISTTGGKERFFFYIAHLVLSKMVVFFCLPAHTSLAAQVVCLVQPQKRDPASATAPFE